MLTDSEEKLLLKMVTEIYHHLGLDEQRPFSINNIKEKAEKDVLKWREKKSKRSSWQ
jgi:hypothetical protein